MFGWHGNLEEHLSCLFMLGIVCIGVSAHSGESGGSGCMWFLSLVTCVDFIGNCSISYLCKQLPVQVPTFQHISQVNV